MLLDQMRTWNASGAQTLGKLRWPAALPYLFASLKVGVAASLVGAIIGELPTGAVAGLGARMLSGSYYGQTVQIWSALFMAAILAAVSRGADRAHRAGDQPGDGGAALSRVRGLAPMLIAAVLVWLGGVGAERVAGAAGGRQRLAAAAAAAGLRGDAAA